MMKLVAVLVLGSLAGCPLDPCNPADTRCFGYEAQVCGSDGRWRTFMDCSDLGSPGWRCCWLEANEGLGVPTGHGCIRTEVCP